MNRTGSGASPAESLERVRYAARLHRDTGLPLLVTGGRLFGETGDEATLMKQALTEDFTVPVAFFPCELLIFLYQCRITYHIAKQYGSELAIAAGGTARW